MGQKADKILSGGEMDYDDGEVDKRLADDPHPKSLPNEMVDHATASHVQGDRVSIFRSKFTIHND
jgi:hypothetical protein